MAETSCFERFAIFRLFVCVAGEAPIQIAGNFNVVAHIALACITEGVRIPAILVLLQSELGTATEMDLFLDWKQNTTIKERTK